MSNQLFTPPYIRPEKKPRLEDLQPILYRNEIYESRLNNQEVYGRRKKGLWFSTQQASDITSANLKVSASGPISSHSDVETTVPETGQVLAWDGVNWVNDTMAGVEWQYLVNIDINNLKVSADGPINSLSDVETTSPTIGDLLSWNGTNWVNIAITGISNQQATNITSANLKVSADGPVSSHSDVETTSPTIGDLLSWNGTNWVNITAITGISNQQATDILSNNLKVSASGPISSHSDVQVINPRVNDLLSWNGTNWVTQYFNS